MTSSSAINWRCHDCARLHPGLFPGLDDQEISRTLLISLNAFQLLQVLIYVVGSIIESLGVNDPLRNRPVADTGCPRCLFKVSGERRLVSLELHVSCRHPFPLLASSWLDLEQVLQQHLMRSLKHN